MDTHTQLGGQMLMPVLSLLRRVTTIRIYFQPYNNNNHLMRVFLLANLCLANRLAGWIHSHNEHKTHYSGPCFHSRRSTHQLWSIVCASVCASSFCYKDIPNGTHTLKQANEYNKHPSEQQKRVVSPFIRNQPEPSRAQSLPTHRIRDAKYIFSMPVCLRRCSWPGRPIQFSPMALPFPFSLGRQTREAS